MVLTFCINSTRGRGGHESPRWIRALGKGDGRTNRDLWSSRAMGGEDVVGEVKGVEEVGV